MSADKYPRIFPRQMEAIVYLFVLACSPSIQPVSSELRYRSTVRFLDEIITEVEVTVYMTYLINTSSAAVKPTARALHAEIDGL